MNTNDRILEALVALGVYSARVLTEEEYNRLKGSNTNENLIYISNESSISSGNGVNRTFREIDTKGISIEEAKLLIDIENARNVRSIKQNISVIMISVVVCAVLLALKLLG